MLTIHLSAGEYYLHLLHGLPSCLAGPVMLLALDGFVFCGGRLVVAVIDHRARGDHQARQLEYDSTQQRLITEAREQVYGVLSFDVVKEGRGVQRYDVFKMVCRPFRPDSVDIPVSAPLSPATWVYRDGGGMVATFPAATVDSSGKVLPGPEVILASRRNDHGLPDNASAPEPVEDPTAWMRQFE